MRPLPALLLLAAGCASGAAVRPDGLVPAPGHWPQARGPRRDGVSSETGLLREWTSPPRLLWTAKGLGEGTGGIVVAGGLIYAVGYREGRERATALDGAGRTVWTTDLGSESGERKFMRYVVPRTPTVDDDRLYLLTCEGRLLCLDSSDGRPLWERSYPKDFRSRRSAWGYGEFPLVDGERLICMPNGADGMLVALDKATGRLLWQTAELKPGFIHAGLVPAEIGGVPQVVAFAYEGVAGVDRRSGVLLWRAERRGMTAVVPFPVVSDGIVFVTSGFGVGHAAFRVEAVDGRFRATPLYSGREMVCQRQTPVLLGAHVYGLHDNGRLVCLELATGRIAWEQRDMGKGAVLAADGLLFCRAESPKRGTVRLVEATPEAYREKGAFDLPGVEWIDTPPVVAGGRLYLRDQDTLHCFDVRGPDYREPARPWDILSRVPSRGSAAPAPESRPPGVSPALPPVLAPPAFVPTPHDVVKRMLEEAAVTWKDVVVDLGSGDGRILIAAVRDHRCLAVGYETDRGLMDRSREAAAQAGVAERVWIHGADLFRADLSPASVITLYLGEENNARLLPRLRALRPGVRIVSHQHGLGPAGPPPDRSVRIVSSEDGAEHAVHVWTTPLK